MAEYSPEVESKTGKNIVSSLDETERKRIAALVSDRFRNATEAIRPKIEESREAWDFYLNNKPELEIQNKKASSENTSGIAGLRLGSIPRSVDSIVAVLYNSIFPADERFFRGTPTNDAGRRFQELIEVSRAINYAKANVTEEFKKALVSYALDPALCVAMHWKKKTRRKVSYEPRTIKFNGLEFPMPLLGLKKKVDEEFVDWEGTAPEVLSFNDWRVDPYAQCPDESWFIVRWYDEAYEVKKEFGLDEVKPYGEVFDQDQSQKYISAGLQPPISLDDEDEGKDKALLMAMYDDIMVDGEVKEDYLAVVLNGCELVYLGPNENDHGEVPYKITTACPIPGQIYGNSLIKHAIPSACIIDDCVRAILGIASWAAGPVFEIPTDEPIFRQMGQSFKVFPGATIPVKRAGALRQIPINLNNLPILESIIQKAEENIREVTGSNPAFAGDDFSNQPANITAFQVEQHIQGGNSRFQVLLRNFCNNIIEPFLRIDHINNQQYKTKTEYAAIGDEIKELEPDIIKQADFDWVITGAQASTSRGRRLANLQALLMNILPGLVQSGVAQLAPQEVTINQGEALKQLMVLGGEVDFDRLVTVKTVEPQNGLPQIPQPNPAGAGANPVPPPEQLPGTGPA